MLLSVRVLNCYREEDSVYVAQYWLVIYCVILLEEHFIFRKARWSRYNVDDYTDPKKLPTGLAAALALSLGIVGAVLGKSLHFLLKSTLIILRNGNSLVRRCARQEDR